MDGGINTYAYVEGNPISNIDPLGLQTETGRKGKRGFPIPFGGTTPSDDAGFDHAHPFKLPNSANSNIIQFPGSINISIPGAAQRADPKYCPTDPEKKCDSDLIRLTTQYASISEQTQAMKDAELDLTFMNHLKARHNKDVDDFEKLCPHYKGRVIRFWVL